MQISLSDIMNKRINNSQKSDPAPSAEPWLFWYDDPHEPALNMALDEALLFEVNSVQPKQPVVRFYQWDRPAVSIGYIQKHSAAEEYGYAVVRRPTGGGVVLHDYDFTYSVAIPSKHWLIDVDRVRNNGDLSPAEIELLEGLRLETELGDSRIQTGIDRQSMVCFENPTKYDILFNDQKIAGSAQRRLREGILHQGSVHFDEQLPFNHARLAESITAGFVDALNIEAQTFMPCAELLEEAEQIADSKYRLESWNKKRP